jgi:hypothetical protein
MLLKLIMPEETGESATDLVGAPLTAENPRWEPVDEGSKEI